METNLYKVYYRSQGRLTNGFVQASTQDEAVERFNRLFPKLNMVKIVQITLPAPTLH